MARTRSAHCGATTTQAAKASFTSWTRSIASAWCGCVLLNFQFVTCLFFVVGRDVDVVVQALTRDTLKHMLCDDELRDAQVLVLANKQCVHERVVWRFS